MSKIWRLKDKSNRIIKEAEKIEKKYKLGRLVSTMLADKRVNDNQSIETFINPNRQSFGDPFELPDMKKAVDRIVKAIEKNERIIVYGDYDADGITSSSILKRFMKEIDVDIDIYIPNRLTEGYGLNEKAVRDIAEKGYNLIITVDCGITSIEETELAKSLGVDVIITDHHEPGEEIPNAIAVVDCKRKDNSYKFRELAGCGVAFKVTQALSAKLDIQEDICLRNLDLACIGTISDIVPLIDENRVIAKLGLLLVNQLRNTGIRELVKVSGIKQIDASAISFGISPRINACGRMGHHEDALELFLTDDPIKARKLAQSLEKYNRKRQEIEKKMYKEAEEIAKLEENKKSLVLAKEGWHHGIIGIVSSKITENYYKPSILLCIEGETSRGSGRSIPGFDLHEAVEKCSKELDNYGGHGMAIGLSLKTDNIEKFKEEFEKYSNKKINTDMIKQYIDIDEEITSKDISLNEIRQLKILEPFGESNFEPVVLYKNLKINSIRTLSEGKHLKLNLQDGNVNIDAIGFNIGELAEQYQIDDKIDIVGNIGINTFNNIDRIQVVLKDMRKAVQ